MDGDLTTAAGWTFLATDATGRTSDDHHGLYHRDTRYFDRLELDVGGRHLDAEGAIAPRPGEHVVAATAQGGRDPDAAVRRTRFVPAADGGPGPGCYERIAVRNRGAETLSATLRVAVGTRFDDVFEVRGIVQPRTRSVGVAPGEGVAFSYEPDDGDLGRRAGAGIDADAQVDVHGGLDRADAVLATDLRIEPGATTAVDVAATVGGVPRDPAAAVASAREHVRERARTWWRDVAAPPVADDRAGVVRAGLADLRSLTADTEHGPVPTAGTPWFAAPFGRDALLAAYGALPLVDGPARSTLRYTAAYQAREHDAARDAEPGKVLHEHRRGELAARREIPHTPYFGSVDATPLWVVLLHETWRTTGDDALVRDLADALDRALDWLASHDGFLTYDTDRDPTRPPGGLVHQGWKDSDDGIVHPDGGQVDGPVALAEAQGYASDALRRAADLHRAVLDDPDRARALDRQATVLAEAFDESFWLPEAGTYAVALDGIGATVRTVTSNPGHCLWSGIVPADRADAVVDRLLDDDLFTGWGLRTVAAGQGAYDPDHYHRGAVWPHDTALAAIGMARYGREDAAARLVDGLFDAARDRGGHLPELFAGHDRAEHDGVVTYPEACEPQAWAAVASLAGLRATEGLGPDLDVV